MTKTIRINLFEHESETDARIIHDIREFEAPTLIEALNWSQLARHSLPPQRKLLLALAKQIDDLIVGHIDEINIFLVEKPDDV